MGLIDDLHALVDTEIGVGEWHTVTQEQVNQFADATLDHQWIHIDEEKAKQGPFGTTIAHGFLTLSMLVHLTPTIDLPDVKMAVNYGLDRVRFVSPVPVGSRIRARSVLREAREAGGGIQTKNEVTVEIEGREKPALVAEWLGRFYV